MAWANPHQWPLAYDFGDQHFELPAAAEIIAERSRIMARNARIENDMRTRNLLKRWVSELEPVLFVRAGDWRVFGVGAKGHSEPTIMWEDLAR